jgi:hypothetical protein
MNSSNGELRSETIPGIPFNVRAFFDPQENLVALRGLLGK